MDGETAKKLKDSGFPDSKIVRQDVLQIDDWFSPDLLTLIKACGDRFKTLIHPNSINNGNQWGAQSCIYEGEQWVKYGSTPEIAVANLYLELKNKKNG